MCAGSEDSNDYDGDGVPDVCDICAGSDDSVDGDYDGVPDGCNFGRELPYTVTRLSSSPQIDGNLSEWLNVPGMTVGTTASCSAVLKIAYDDLGMYIAFDVLNDNLDVHGDYWKVDSLEFGYDPCANCIGDQRFLGVLTAGGTAHEDLMAAQMSAVLDGTSGDNSDVDVGYVIEASLRWTDIPHLHDYDGPAQTGDVWGIYFRIVDYGNGQRQYYPWPDQIIRRNEAETYPQMIFQ